jgi:iron(III) transport system permease protein
MNGGTPDSINTVSRWLSTVRRGGEKLLRNWYLTVPAVVVIVGVCVPLVYLFVRAFEADLATLNELVIRWRNLRLLWNTGLLTIGVLIGSSILALPMAWLTARVDLWGRTLFTVLGVLPLAIPGYVMAYALLGATGSNGILHSYLGLFIPRLDGLDGSILALSITTFPYLFLNLRTAFLGIDTSMQESARTLGAGGWDVFFRVVLPQLKPAYLAGSLLVGLHVLGDFGVVSLMRFETFSYALFIQYRAAFDRIYAACLALMMLALTVGALVVEAYLLKGMVVQSGERDRVDREGDLVDPGGWRWLGYGFAGAVAGVCVVLPVVSVLSWSSLSVVNEMWSELGVALWNSVRVSVPAALLAGLLAVPIAYLGVRYESVWSRGLERVAYLGYATPRLALALAWIVFSLAVLPVAYQTLGLLIGVYALHFMAEAIGPIRSTFYQISPNLSEAARSLGTGSIGVFTRIIFPLLRRGVLVGVAFVFLSTIKDLPLALLLSPPGFPTLATTTWGYAEEAMFAPAAPFALAIMVVSACFVGFLFRNHSPGT